MYVTGITSGSVRNRAIATPSKTSSASGTPTIRRFDVLLNEQVSLVTNAQDGLKQALEFYEKASSKEEQESARLQVQSLLSRAEELVLLLQVVIHIRREFTHTQLYAMDLRKKGKDTTEVMKRLTWLEHRLEKLLFARRRGRPGARGRRTQISRQYMTEHRSQMDNRYPPSTPMDRVSTALPSVAADDSDSDLCNSSNSSSVDEHGSDNVKQHSRQSYYSTDNSLQIRTDDRTKSSVNEQLPLDKTDVTDTVATQGLDVLDVADAPLPSYILNFERPKSGCDRLSWSALPLAINSSFFSKREPPDPCSKEDIHSENSVMDVLIEKIEMFASYIEMAAQTFTTPGLCLPVLRKLSPEKKQMSSSRMKQSAKIHNELSAKLTAAKLPPLQVPCMEWPPITWSRQKYGQQNDDNLYPNDFTKWCGPKLSSQSFSTIQRKSSARLPSQLRARIPSSKSKSRNLGKRLTNEEYFEPEKHRHRLIQDLLRSLRSPIDDVRKDSAQALGALGAGRIEIIKPLEELMINDSNYLVQFESAKSLITLGEWSKSLVDFITYTMANGPSIIQAELLELLVTVEDLSPLEEYKDSYCRCVQFTSEIVRVNAISGLSLLAAVVVSNMNHQYINCQGAIIERLQNGLTDDVSRNRSKALSSLAVKWNVKDIYVVEEALEQLCKLFEWTLRLEAVKVLLHIGKDGLLKLGEAHVFKILVDKLSNDPIQTVRFNVGKLITAIGWRMKTLDLLLKQLNDHNDNVRMKAVMAMGNFDLKGTKYMQGLLDLLELDANKNVRVQVLRVFGNIKFYEARVIEKLLERDKGSGIIAKEAQKALKNLEKENIIKKYSN